MNDRNEVKLSLIRDYIKNNIGDFNEDVFTTTCGFDYNRFECSMMVIKVSLEECNVQVEVFKTSSNIELVMKFKDWFAKNIANSECEYSRKNYFENIEWICWDYTEHEKEDAWNGVINELTERGMILTRGCVQSIHGGAKYKTLCSGVNGYNVIFDGENHISIWGISAKSFEDAWLKAKSVIDVVKDVRHFKGYNYNFVNCMSGYNIEVAF